MRHPVMIYKPYGRYENVERVIRDCHPTGIAGKTMGCTKLYQWQGWIYLHGFLQDVYGWTSTDTMPAEWSNDTG